MSLSKHQLESIQKQQQADFARRLSHDVAFGQRPVHPDEMLTLEEARQQRRRELTAQQYAQESTHTSSGVRIK